MLSRFFISRPIFACVVSAFIVIAGLAALRGLPVAELPEILPPQVVVQATYPGATAETIASTVATPLEQQINGVERMLYMNSVSSGDGTLSVTLTFETGTNLDLAAINVNNRVQSALSRLPEEVRRQGVVVRKSGSAILLVVTLQSSDQSQNTLTISNYASLNIIDELKRIPGVADAVNYSNKNYSLRIWLDPGKLAKLGLTPADVADAVREQNSQYTAGAVGAEPTPAGTDFRFTVTADGRYSTPEQFENIIVHATGNGAVVRLKDVARVELGAQRYDFDSRLNGQPAIPIGVTLLAGANALDVSNAIRQRMDELAVAFPAGLKYSIPFNTADYVRVSIREVIKTLIEAMLLVFLVVLLFLQNLRATLIPMLAVPVSLIGTLAAMYLFGFSINTLTLFGIVLSIGIVVDDAIVVLENVERIMTDEGLSPRAATEKAMLQVTGPVIAIVLVLTSVFTPIAFLGGLVGEMYRQFAVTIAVSVAISGFVALTLTPALCALLLRSEDTVQHGLFARFQSLFAALTGRYARGVSYFLRHSMLVVGVLVLTTVAIIGLYRHIPTALVPDEDKGYVMAVAILPDAAALSRTSATTQQVSAAMREHPAIENVFSFDGYDPINSALRTNVSTIWIVMEDWSKRSSELTPASVVEAVYKAAAGIKDGLVLGFEPPPITGISNTGGFEAFVQARGNADPRALAAATQKLVNAAAQRKEVTGVSTTFSAAAPQVHISVDREKAKLLGIALDEIYTALQSTFGAYYINDFNRDGRVYQVQMQSEAAYRARAENIREVYVKNAAGNLLPLTAIASVSEVTGPEVVQRFNVFPAASITGNPAGDYSSGEAIRAMDELAAEVLPQGYTLAWSGAYLQEKLSGGASSGMLLLGVLMVFLILAAQYERWGLPLAVILAVPFAMLGAMLAVWARGLQNDVYFQIGLVTLVGLSAKNAILIVEFAMMKTAEGADLLDAALEAARLRFRPIIMTSMAFVFGVIPLAFSSGAGAGSRHAIGTGVIGGMLVATFIATLFIPVFYVWAARLGKSSKQPAE
ncbi:MAG: multidrug efflux RND transporter permease subunit [Steroidobacteraceae bacterium]